MLPIQLYDYTRGQWKINVERANKAKYAFAVYQGIIQEAYIIHTWYSANSTFNVRTNFTIKRPEDTIHGRYEFIGNIAPNNIRKAHRYKSVEHYFKKGNANPIMYLNV